VPGPAAEGRASRRVDALRRGYARWAADYARFATARGFRTFNDWPYHRRGFIECWAQPGFHRFWQVWNPGIAYFVYRTYLALGGRRHWLAPSIGAFVLCGLVHTVIVAPFLGRWSYSVIVAFGCFGLLSVISRLLAPVLRQRRWPGLVNVLVNIALVVGSFDLGFRVDHLLRP
jgi:hypothetical protein